MLPSKPLWPYSQEDLLNLSSNRKSKDAQLWIVGCSFAHGIGILESQRFGNIIAEKLQLPVSFLTRPGSSIDWAADQIIRSDIQQNDIVVWGITGASRFAYYDDFGCLHNVNPVNFDSIANLKNYMNITVLLSNQMIYNSIPKIEQVKNFLQKINSQFIFGLLPLCAREHDVQLMHYISSIKNGLILFDHNNLNFIDKANDNLHPGPLHHTWYADTILDFYNKTYK